MTSPTWVNSGTDCRQDGPQKHRPTRPKSVDRHGRSHFGRGRILRLPGKHQPPSQLSQNLGVVMEEDMAKGRIVARLLQRNLRVHLPGHIANPNIMEKAKARENAVDR